MFRPWVVGRGSLKRPDVVALADSLKKDFTRSRQAAKQSREEFVGQERGRGSVPFRGHRAIDETLCLRIFFLAALREIFCFFLAPWVCRRRRVPKRGACHQGRQECGIGVSCAFELVRTRSGLRGLLESVSSPPRGSVTRDPQRKSSRVENLPIFVTALQPNDLRVTLE
jgi:hypothetical protein